MLLYVNVNKIQIKWQNKAFVHTHIEVKRSAKILFRRCYYLQHCPIVPRSYLLHRRWGGITACLSHVKWAIYYFVWESPWKQHGVIPYKEFPTRLRDLRCYGYSNNHVVWDWSWLWLKKPMLTIGRKWERNIVLFPVLSFVDPSTLTAFLCWLCRPVTTWLPPLLPSRLTLRRALSLEHFLGSVLFALFSPMWFMGYEACRSP